MKPDDEDSMVEDAGRAEEFMRVFDSILARRRPAYEELAKGADDHLDATHTSLRNG